MIAALYLHHERTVVAQWQTDESAPTLTALELLPPIAMTTDPLPADVARALAHAMGEADDIRLAVPSRSILLHRYPVEADEAEDLRRAFELATCVPVIDPVHDQITDVDLPGPVNESAWHALIAVPQRIIARAHDIVGERPSATISVVPSLLADISAARRAGFVGQGQTTMLIGLRADAIETAVFDPAGQLLHLTFVPREERYDASVQARELVLDACASMDIAIDDVVLYGDDLSKSVLDDCTRSLDELVGRVLRFTPFRATRATVDDESRSTCLRLAHRLGPVVGLL